MPTITATGYSNSTLSSAAAAEVADQALAALNGQAPSLALVFCSTGYDYNELLRTLKDKLGIDAIVGCTTAGEFNENSSSENAVSLMLIASDQFQKVIRAARGLKNDYQKSITGALGNFKENQRNMMAQGYMHSTILVLSDGLAGRGEEMVATIQEMTGAATQLVGGAAGDNGKFEQTSIFAGDQAYTDTIIMVQLFSKKPIGIGVRHGLNPKTEAMRVTRSEGAVLYELDGKPAFDAYREYAAKLGQTIDHENAGGFMIANELGIQMFSDVTKIRAPLSANPDGSLNMATEVPPNAMISIMDGERPALLSAAAQAAEEAKVNLRGNPAAGIVVFDCICRGIMLAEDFPREIETIRSPFGEVPVVGFRTYGEIAKFGGQLNGFHNSTAVVCAFPE